jgi:hypothetical protein
MNALLFLRARRDECLQRLLHWAERSKRLIRGQGDLKCEKCVYIPF